VIELPQLTFHEVQTLSLLDNFTIIQRKVAVFLREQVPQAEIARKLNKSRSYVGQIVKLFLDNNLIKPVATTPKNEGRRHYNQFFEILTPLQKKLADDKTPPVTPFRTHHIIRKFKILRQSKELSKDHRTGWNKSWEMRGGTRHEYWYSGEISVSVIVHPKTIVAMICKGQKVIAETAEQAEDRGIQLVINTVNKFVELQQLFGVHLEIDEIGQQVGKTHFGLAFHRQGQFSHPQTTMKDWWDDNSPEGELGPGMGELETKIKSDATEVERGIRDVITIKRELPSLIQTAMPEAMQEFNKQFGDLSSEVHQVMAYVQSGQSFQNQLNQLTLLVAQLIKQNHELQDELKKRG
jgi:hypothetical protein